MNIYELIVCAKRARMRNKQAGKWQDDKDITVNNLGLSAHWILYCFRVANTIH